MQVSWIDPADVAALAKNLLRPLQTPKQTVSDDAAAGQLQAETLIPPEGFLHADENAEVVEIPGHGTKATQHHHVSAADDDEYVEEDEVAAAPVVAGSVSAPNLGAFRERLRAIREHAIGAGLISGKVNSNATTSPVALSAPESVSAPGASAEVGKSQPLAPEAKGAGGKPVPTLAQRLEAFTQWASERVGSDEILVVGDQGDLLGGRHSQSELILSTLMARNAASRTTARLACGDPTPHHHPLASGKTLTVIPCETRYGLIQIAVSTAYALPVEASNRLREALVSAMNTES